MTKQFSFEQFSLRRVCIWYHMEYIELIEDIIEQQPAIQPRRLFDRTDPVDHYTDFEFRDRFRMHKDSFAMLAILIVPHIRKDASRGRPIPPQLELLATIRFYATGCFLREVGDLLGLSETSSCRIIHRVSSIIAAMRANYIIFPSNEDLAVVKRDFYNISGLPGSLDASMDAIFLLNVPPQKILKNTGVAKVFFA